MYTGISLSFTALNDRNVSVVDLSRLKILPTRSTRALKRIVNWPTCPATSRSPSPDTADEFTNLASWTSGGGCHLSESARGASRYTLHTHGFRKL